jgi:hypothetical protein
MTRTIRAPAFARIRLTSSSRRSREAQYAGRQRLGHMMDFYLPVGWFVPGGGLDGEIIAEVGRDAVPHPRIDAKARRCGAHLEQCRRHDPRIPW